MTTTTCYNIHAPVPRTPSTHTCTHIMPRQQAHFLCTNTCTAGMLRPHLHMLHHIITDPISAISTFSNTASCIITSTISNTASCIISSTISNTASPAKAKIIIIIACIKVLACMHYYRNILVIRIIPAQK